MIRVRFNGSACASQPVVRHPEVRRKIGLSKVGARVNAQKAERKKGGAARVLAYAFGMAWQGWAK